MGRVCLDIDRLSVSNYEVGWQLDFRGTKKTALCPDRSDATVSADRRRQRESNSPGRLVVLDEDAHDSFTGCGTDTFDV
ncbi:hypothetical protein NSND_62691 [Nitrospira sp. ND1]|nr:hypothetical protein NSND_62691 [Nitrospira sp. ND1]